jgi:putative endopeptidase
MSNHENNQVKNAKSGLDFQHCDNQIRPQDDLFAFMNGKWLAEAEIPADRAGDSAFYQLFEAAEKNVRSIIEEQSQRVDTSKRTPHEQKIGDLYTSFMNVDDINARGFSPIAQDLTNALTPSSKDEFLLRMAEMESRGRGGSLFYLYINTDDADSSTYISCIGQSGLSLPDEAYYREENYAQIRVKFIDHVVKMLTLAQVDKARERAEAILNLETQIASHHWDQVKSRDAIATYNKMTFAQLQELTPHFNWSEWQQEAKVPTKILATTIAHQPSYFIGIDQLLAEFDSFAWSSWLAWHLILGAAPYLSDEFVDERFDFYGRTLSGIPMLRERWKRGVALVEGALGEAVGEIYVNRHFPREAKNRMMGLVNNLIEAYRISINELDWMSPETKIKAIEKLEKFNPKIGYPDKWRDYSSLLITPDDLIGNLERINLFGQEIEYAKIGSPVDRSEWFMTPQTVNAYYNPGLNEIVFPAAILQPPFFDLEADDAANYGGIGAVIGHEIGHGFDDQGSQYDGLGNLNNWWSEKDREEFYKRAQVLINQYDQLSPTQAPDVHVNGALTIGENIGDLGGAVIAFKAYQLSLVNKSGVSVEAPVIDGYTGEQRFFLAFSQVGRGKYRPEEVRRRIAIDPHSPDEFRVNQIVKNMSEYVEAFDLKPGDGLYLPPEERVKIW